MQDSKEILAVGSIAIDTLETPNGNRDNILGGSATYFSLAAGLLAPVKLVGVVGNDYPETGWNIFKSHNINTDNVQVINGKTFRWGCKYNHNYSARDTLFTLVQRSMLTVRMDQPSCSQNRNKMNGIRPESYGLMATGPQTQKNASYPMQLSSC